MKKLLKTITESHSLSVQELANKTGYTRTQVERKLKNLEKEKIVLGCIPLLNPDKLEGKLVEGIISIKVQPERGEGFDRVAKRIARFPQVLNVFLVSGGYDLIVTISGKSLREVAQFVSEKLSTLPGVESTQTNFLLKKYKEGGVELFVDQKPDRLKVSA